MGTKSNTNNQMKQAYILSKFWAYSISPLFACKLDYWFDYRKKQANKNT